MRISVEQPYIDKGVPGYPRTCMVAVAVEKRLKPGFRVVVALRTIEVYELANVFKFTQISTPYHVRQAIARFDLGLSVEPFSFDLPDEWPCWKKESPPEPVYGELPLEWPVLVQTRQEVGI